MERIAFAGKMQVGKTKFADYLVQKSSFVKHTTQTLVVKRNDA